MPLVKFTPQIWYSGGYNTTTTGVTLNAAGESAAVIGHLMLPGQTGSKVCSAAGGGAIFWNSASGITFADAGSNLRIGIQDVTTATGLEDGTFDVYADLVGGTDTIGNNTLFNTPMETGTKTMSHGDLIAIGIELTARGGSDVVTIDLSAGTLFSYGFPYSTTDTGSLGKTGAMMLAMIKFDDGTYGWIANAPLLNNAATGATTISFNSGSTPDEYAAVFRVPVPMTCIGIGTVVGAVATTDPFELILYSDPLGTPVAERTWAPDPDGLISGNAQIPSITPYDLAAGTDYAIALRPTTTNNVTWSYFDNGSGFDVLKIAQPFTSIKMASRTDQTGGFSETQVYHLPDIFLVIGALSDGESSSGAEVGAGFVAGMHNIESGIS